MWPLHTPAPDGRYLGLLSPDRDIDQIDGQEERRLSEVMLIRVATAIADAASDADEALALCVLAAAHRGQGRDFLCRLAAAVGEHRDWDLRLTFH
jgi:hypothetical protein